MISRCLRASVTHSRFLHPQQRFHLFALVQDALLIFGDCFPSPRSYHMPFRAVEKAAATVSQKPSAATVGSRCALLPSLWKRTFLFVFEAVT